LAPVLVTAGANAQETPIVEKAIAFGTGRGDIPLVIQDDSVGQGTCETVELASPALRVARVSRRASLKSQEADRSDLATAARPTLSVLYGRELFRSASRVVVISRRNVGSGPATPTPIPCPEDRKPSRIVLAGRSGETLEPIQDITIVEKQWKRGLASGTVFGGIAEFDLASALALAGGKDLEIRVMYADGKPSAFRFSSKQLRDLTPSWAR
jgi:hypothetical protein